MIYTHVLARPDIRVTSPLDRLDSQVIQGAVSAPLANSSSNSDSKGNVLAPEVSFVQGNQPPGRVDVEYEDKRMDAAVVSNLDSQLEKGPLLSENKAPSSMVLVPDGLRCAKQSWFARIQACMKFRSRKSTTKSSTVTSTGTVIHSG